MLCLHLGGILVLTDSVILSLVHVDILKIVPSLAMEKILVDKWKAVFSWSLLSRWAVMLWTSWSFFSVLMCMFLYLCMCVRLCTHTSAYFQPTVVIQRSVSVFVVFHEVSWVNYRCYWILPASQVTVVRSPKRCCELVIDFEGSTDDEPGTQAYYFTEYFQNTFLLCYVLVLSHAGTYSTYLGECDVFK